LIETLLNFFEPPGRRLPRDLARRFLHLFDAHNVDHSQIPRLIPGIAYGDLAPYRRLIDALTPAVVDATAQLFGVRRQWLECLDDLVLHPYWDHGDPKQVLTRLAGVVAATLDAGNGLGRFPLRVLTTSMTLAPESSERQWLLPVIVEPVSDSEDCPAYRCQVSGDYYDWTDSQSRIELKAITWLAWHRLRITVPLFQVSHDEFDSIRGGMAVPTIILRSGLITEPSLEDFIQTPEESRVAKEADELPAVLGYLDAEGLRDFTVEILPPTAVMPSEAVALQNSPAAVPEHEEPQRRSAPGKREAQRTQWAAIVGAAQAIWSQDQSIDFADMIRRLKSMPHLKANALSDSAIHKHIRAAAPPEVRGKPGRKPFKSA
jgi:hypothetical protein